MTLSELKATNRTAPVYPKRLESRGTTGSATIAFTVNINGTTSNIIVESVEPLSAAAFGTSAQKAVESWSFEPYQDADGNVRIANSKISIVFQ